MADQTPGPERDSGGPARRVADLLGVERGEGAGVALMLAHSFCMGLATVLFETAASALFLTRFDATALPFVYLAAAAASAAAGALYTGARGRISFGRQMAGTLLALMLVTLALRAGMGVSGAAALPFALMVWYRVLSILTDLEYWAVATRLFDVRQAKRLYGLIGSGEVVARIAGAFSVPLLLAATRVENLLLLSASALGACLALLVALLRRPALRDAPDHAAGGAPDEAGRSSLAEVLRRPYLRLLIGVAFLGVLGKYFVDFAYLAEVRGRVGGTRELASFLALFSGVSQSVSLLTRIFLSRRVLARWGVRAGLMVLPLMQLACTLLLLGSGLLPGAAALGFWLVVANQGVYKSLKHPIDNPSFKILYQPIRREERLSTQVVVETVASPLAIALAGLVMLVFSRAMVWSETLFALPLLVTFALWALAASRAGSAYAAALVASLRGRIKAISYSFDDERNLPLIRRALARGQPREVLFALEILDQAGRSGGRQRHRRPAPLEPGEGHPQLPPLVSAQEREQLMLSLLSHPAPDVRAAVLLRIERRWSLRAAAEVQQLLRGEQEPLVLGAGLRALAASRFPADLVRIQAHLDDPRPAVRHGALVALLGAGQGRERLESLAGSEQPALRARAARAMAESRGDDPSGVLARLLADPDPQVCRLALAAVGRRGDAPLWPAVTRSLADPRLAAAAGASLVAGGAGALPALLEARRGAEPQLVAGVIRALGRIGGPEAIAALSADIDVEDGLLRSAALEALVRCGAVLDHTARERAEEQLLREVEGSEWTGRARRDLADSPELSALANALADERWRQRDRVLSLLALLHDRQAVLRARRSLAHESKERRAAATEVLDLAVPGPLKARVLPLLSGEDPLATRPGRITTARERLEELLERGAAHTGPWALACAVDAVARLRAAELLPSVAALADDSSHPVVREAAASTLRRLGATPDQPAGGRRMNTIERVLTLKGVDMFSLASEEALVDIAAILEEVVAEPGETIIERGEVGDSMYIIIEGRVRVFDGERTVARLAARDIFGELALLDPEPRLASIAADGETRLFRLDREAFLELLAGNIEIVRGVLQVLCTRLRRSVLSGADTDRGDKPWLDTAVPSGGE